MLSKIHLFQKCQTPDLINSLEQYNSKIVKGNEYILEEVNQTMISKIVKPKTFFVKI